MSVGRAYIVVILNISEGYIIKWGTEYHFYLSS